MLYLAQEYYLVALSQPRAERLAELHMDGAGKSLAAKMVSLSIHAGPSLKALTAGMSHA